VTGDILLADRALKARATVIAHNGRPFTASSIERRHRDAGVPADLRAGGDVVPGGHNKADQAARFLQAIDAAL
jgi:uncharacterized protein YaiI (UPF0178 family)